MSPKWFLCTDGSLCLSTGPYKVVRQNFSCTHREIKTGQDLRATLRAGAYAWPGGYPMYFVTADGAALSFKTVRENLHAVTFAVRHKLKDGWRVIGVDINYEDSELVCEHSGEPIECAYTPN